MLTYKQTSPSNCLCTGLPPFSMTYRTQYGDHVCFVYYDVNFDDCVSVSAVVVLSFCATMSLAPLQCFWLQVCCAGI